MNYVNEQNMQEILDGIARKIGQGGGSGAGLEDWQPSHEYIEKDICVYEGQIYRAKVGFTSDTTFSTTQILEEYTPIGGETIIPYEKDTEISIDDIVSYDSNTYKALYNFVCGEEFSLYALEEYVPKELTEVQEAEIINHFMPNIYSGGNMSIEDSTPIGTIISFMGTIAPENYLVCDGQTYNIVDYIELAEFIKTQFGSYDYFGGDGITTFAVPDLQGEFLRMTGTNSHTNQGSGASVGEHQDGTEIPYSQAWTANASSTNVSLSTELKGDKTSNYPLNEDYDLPSTNRTYASTVVTKTVDGGNFVYAYTSRPTNTSVLYCIKYKMSITNAEEIKDLTTEDIKQIVNSYNPVFEEAKGIEYSTEERRIGTWIDGKPLYQITIQDTMPNVPTDQTRNTKNIDISSLQISLGVSIDGFLMRSGYSLPLNSVNNTVYFRYGAFNKIATNFDNIFLATNNIGDSENPVYITIQYTKTTD